MLTLMQGSYNGNVTLMHTYFCLGMLFYLAQLIESVCSQTFSLLKNIDAIEDYSMF